MKSWAILPFVVASFFLLLSLSHGITQNPFGANLPGGVSGADAAYINITNTITQQSGASATSSVEYTFIYNGTGGVNITLPSYATGIKLFLTGQPYPFSEIPSVRCNSFVINLSQTCTVLEISNVKSTDVFILSYSFSTTYTSGAQFNSTFIFIPFSPTLLRIVTVLPQGAFLSSAPYYNPPTASFSSNGQNIEVIWSLFQYTAGAILPFTVSYSDSLPNQAPQPTTSYIIAGAIVAGIIISLIILMRSKRRAAAPSPPKKRLNPFRKLLSEDEEKALKLIKRGRYITQKELILASGFSKSKMSKMLSKLSRFKLIKIQSLGKINKIKRT